MRFFLLFFTISISTLGSAQTLDLWARKTTISLAGTINTSMTEALKKTLQMAPPRLQEINIVLNSTGGSVVEGLKIIKILSEQKQIGRKIITWVPNGATCGSMCVPIFVQGDIRRAGPAASFMFHAAHQQILGLLQVTDLELTQNLLDTFLEAGVSKTWLDHLKEMGVFSSPKAYWWTGQELVQDQSHIITELLPRYDDNNSFDIFGTKVWTP